MDLYLRVRKACLVDGMSVREASRVFGVHRDTVNKMLSQPRATGIPQESVLRGARSSSPTRAS